MEDFQVYYKESDRRRYRIVYQTFDINEIMLTKIERGHEDFDLICPSEYIIERMLKKNLLVPIDRNFGKTPDYLDNISPYIREPTNKLSQPGLENDRLCRPIICGERQGFSITSSSLPKKRSKAGNASGTPSSGIRS